MLDPGEAADLTVTLKNVGRDGVAGLAGVLRTADAYVSIADSLGSFGDVAPESSRANDLDRFHVTAAANTPKEHECSFTLLLAGTDYADTLMFSFQVGIRRAVDPIPDGPREPACYWAYDDKDSLWPRHPDYSWVEVNSVGTRLNYPNNDAVIVVDLPPAFGPVKYYDQRYTQLSVSADGWIVPGSYTTTGYTNTELPSQLAPPGAICVNWDDLYPGYSSAGYAYYYHDAANHRFVVEFDSVAYYDASTVRDKFQFVVYDTTLASPSGNSVFDFQYMTANRTASSTVGLQDQARAVAIQALFDGSYDHGCWPLGARRAIRFTTDDPTGLAEERSLPSAPAEVRISPNPFAGGTWVCYTARSAGELRLTAYDRSGREVAHDRSTVKAGPGARWWQPGDLAPGVYFVKVSTPDSETVHKALLTR